MVTSGLTFDARRAGDSARVQSMDMFIVVAVNLWTVVHEMAWLL